MAISIGETISLEADILEIPLLDAVADRLHGCRKERNLLLAKHAHFQVLGNGLESNQTLANFMVPMFVDCGSMPDAQKVFNKLPWPNEHSWTSLIQGYAHYGEHQNALDLFKKMQRDYVPPSGYTYSALLKACGHLRCVEEGHAFHLDAVKHGFEEKPFVTDHVVDMYAKCGSFTEARGMFSGPVEQHARLWTALIVQYAKHGLNEEVLGCLTQMQQEGVTPDDIALVSSLKACSTLRDVNRGQIIHMYIIQEGYEDDIFIGNTLVDFYVHNGLLVEAREVFDGLPIRDVVSWTALISGYAEQGFGQEALRCFDSMLLEGMIPNYVTYFSSLKACATIRAIDKGRILHIAIIKEGLEQKYLVNSALVDLYSKCGALVEAQAVFDALPVRNVVLWTMLMTGYAEHGLAREALNCWIQMHAEGISADAASFVCILKVVGSLRLIEHGFQLHLDVIKEGYAQNSYVSSTLVDMYARCGYLVEAWSALEEMSVRSVVSWTALICGYADHGFGEDALACYAGMQSECLSPNAYTFVCLLKASMVVDSICEGQALHSSIVKCGIDKDLFVGCTLVDMYSKRGFLEEARDSFNALPARDTVVWNSLIITYMECKEFEQALSFLRQMQTEGVHPNAMTWNAVLMGFAEHEEEVTRSFGIFLQMLDQGVLPDGLTFVSVLKACGNSTSLESGRCLHAQVASLSETDVSEAGEVIIATALIDMYSKCGNMIDTQLVFDEMPNRDLLAWATFITGYARHGDCDYVFGLLERMWMEGLKPDEFTFFNVLTACSHAGQVVKGTKFFEDMNTKYGICPSVMHKHCVIDIYSRAGQLIEAVMMLKEMPFHPDHGTWNTLLSACHFYADVDVSMHTFEHVAYLDDNDGSAFVLMSNIYADNDVWEDSPCLDAG